MQPLFSCYDPVVSVKFFTKCVLRLLQVDELQNTIEEDQKTLVEEMRLALDEQKNGFEDASGGSEAMAID